MKKVAVILSGSGYLDGSEIHEATLTLLALDRSSLPEETKVVVLEAAGSN